MFIQKTLDSVVKISKDKLGSSASRCKMTSQLIFLISSRKSLRQNLVQSWTEEAAFLVGKTAFIEAFLSNTNWGKWSEILLVRLPDTMLYSIELKHILSITVLEISVILVGRIIWVQNVEIFSKILICVDL